MDNLYKYETDQFGVSDKSIHLLRNRFNYKSIDFTDINSIKIQKGRDLKNWLWVLLVGCGLLTFVVYDLLHIFNIFSDSRTHVIYIERLLIPLFPFVLGIYSVVISLRKSIVMIVQCRTKTYYLSLRSLIKANEFNDFKIAIKEWFPLTETLE
ncbi:MAG TPA: hypothetical protein VHO90_08450 [Bacteroidales bacterium]|nr:hypothetical protein [Bacteroidales bacterium]